MPRSISSSPEALEAALPLQLIREECARRQLRLTPDRMIVLRALLEHPKGIKAYDLLTQVQKSKPSASAVLVYRALDFFTRGGIVRKINCSSAFIVCEQGASPHQRNSIVLVCPLCRGVTELHDEHALGALNKSLRQAGHRLEANNIEIGAICPACVKH